MFFSFSFNNFFLFDFKLNKNYETTLHYACRSGNVDLVKYLISLNKIDIKSESNVFIYYFFHSILKSLFSFNFKS